MSYREYRLAPCNMVHYVCTTRILRLKCKKCTYKVIFISFSEKGFASAVLGCT